VRHNLILCCVSAPALLQAFVGAVAAFCSSSQHLYLGSQEQQQQLGADGSGEPSQRRRSGLAAGGACSQAAACLNEPKASPLLQCACAPSTSCTQTAAF
jgi:hypothetical protein